MLMEWIRRHDPKFDEHMRTYLFTEESITEEEREAEHGGDAGGTASLQLGSLREETVR
jgi:hypothetical protein